MKVLVTGSRSHTYEGLRQTLLDELHKAGAPIGNDLTIIHGGAPGADTIAGEVAAEWGANEYVFPAEWGTYGKFAGRMRNAEMFTTMHPDLVLAFPLDGSVGTWDCVTQAHKHEVPVTVVGR